jgi:hypothetical protein
MESEVRVSEKISALWRAAVMEYMRLRKADPLHVVDVLWLFSLVMCGNSPVTTILKEKPSRSKLRLFSHANVEDTWDHSLWIKARRGIWLQQTCLICPLASTCELAIPARPYYRKGILLLRPRPKMITGNGFNHLPEPRPEEVEVDQEVLQLLHTMETPVPA